MVSGERSDELDEELSNGERYEDTRSEATSWGYDDYGRDESP